MNATWLNGGSLIVGVDAEAEIGQIEATEYYPKTSIGDWDAAKYRLCRVG